MNFSLFNESKGSSNIVNSTNRGYQAYNFFYPCNNNVDCSPYYAILPSGAYILEVWGARGGSSLVNVGGKGGYSISYFSSQIPIEMYIFLGGVGTSATSSNVIYKGGYNGGGDGGFGTYTTSKAAGGGGGGSDIRINNPYLANRIIVAGGGGGSGSNSIGGNGGGLTGSFSPTTSTTMIGGQGGSYFLDTSPQNMLHSATPGMFGLGGDGSRNNGFSGCGGGGGGYIGGDGGQSTNVGSASNGGAGGGGGSGYVSINPNVLGVEIATIQGQYEFPSINGGSEIGHSDNGCARITLLPSSFSNYIPQTINSIPLLSFSSHLIFSLFFIFDLTL